MSEETEDTGPKMAKKAVGVTQDAALTVLADSNPKREGSSAYDRFEGYLANPAPKTVKEALDNGLTMGDIKYDLIHGSIEVEGASVEEYEITPRGPRDSADAEVEEDDANDDGF